jgi:hypothetical protein
MTIELVERKVKILLRAERMPDNEDGEWIIEGYAATAGMKADGIDVPIEVLRAALPRFMEYPILVAGDHDSDGDPRRTVGRVLSAVVDEVGMFVRAMISKAEPDIWTKINEKILRAFSIGAAVRGRPGPGGGLIAEQMVIRNIVIAPVPVDRSAEFAVARSESDAPAIVPEVVLPESAAAAAPELVPEVPRAGGGGDLTVAGAALTLLGCIAAVTGSAVTAAGAAVVGRSRR